MEQNLTNSKALANIKILAEEFEKENQTHTDAFGSAMDIRILYKEVLRLEQECKDLRTEVATPVLVATNRLADSLAEARTENTELRAELEELRQAITGLLDAANRNVGGMVPGAVAYWCHSALGLLAEKGE